MYKAETCLLMLISLNIQILDSVFRLIDLCSVDQEGTAEGL